MTKKLMPFIKDDGGRAAAGFKGITGDCVTRAVAIALDIPYIIVYQSLNKFCEDESIRLGRHRSSSRTGVRTKTMRGYLASKGWTWVPTMKIGAGCRVHLRAGELPNGRLIARVSGHVVAIVDGTIHDINDPSRNGTRCVYGYFVKEKSNG
jgi:hypothetical protein